jgi:hypothetical protein
MAISDFQSLTWNNNSYGYLDLEVFVFSAFMVCSDLSGIKNQIHALQTLYVPL